MTHAQATRWTILAMVVLGVAAVGRSLTDTGELPPTRTVLGIFVAGALLGLLVEVNPKLAGAFAALVTVGTLLSAGRLFVVIEQALTTPRN